VAEHSVFWNAASKLSSVSASSPSLFSARSSYQLLLLQLQHRITSSPNTLLCKFTLLNGSPPVSASAGVYGYRERCNQTLQLERQVGTRALEMQSYNITRVSCKNYSEVKVTWSKPSY